MREICTSGAMGAGSKGPATLPRDLFMLQSPFFRPACCPEAALMFAGVEW